MEEEFDEYDGPSKSQLKRDAKALVDLGERLLSLPEEQLAQVAAEDLLAAVQQARKITKGNARKRQLQYIGKLLRNRDLTEINQLVARFDASSVEHVTQFHQLEQWRERLIEQDKTVVGEIMEAHADLDHQHLRALVRNAIGERQKDKQPPIHFRKLFQYLKSLSDHTA